MQQNQDQIGPKAPPEKKPGADTVLVDSLETIGHETFAQFGKMRAELHREQAELVYQQLPTFYRDWIDTEPIGGLGGRECCIMIARDASFLTEALKEPGAIDDWSAKQNKDPCLPISQDHTERTLSMTVSLAKKAITFGVK